MASLMLNCKEASAFVSRALDNELPLISRVLLKLHLLVCQRCADCSKQIHFIKAIGRQHLGNENICQELEGLSSEARERIQSRIDQAHTETSTPNDTV